MKSDRPQSEENKEEKSESKLGFSLLKALPEVIRTKINSEFLGKDAHRIASLDHAWHEFVMQPQEARLKIKQEFGFNLPSSVQDPLKIYKRLQRIKLKDSPEPLDLFYSSIIKLEPHFPPLFFTRENLTQLEYKQLDDDTIKFYHAESIRLHNADLLSWLIAHAPQENAAFTSIEDFATNEDLFDLLKDVHLTTSILATLPPTSSIKPSTLIMLIENGHSELVATAIKDRPQLINSEDRIYSDFDKLLEAVGKSGNEKLISQFILSRPIEEKKNEEVEEEDISNIHQIIIGLFKGGHQDQAKKLITDHVISINKKILLAAVEGGALAYACDQARPLHLQQEIHRSIHDKIKKVINDGNKKGFKKLLNELPPLTPELENDLINKILSDCIKTERNSLAMTKLLLEKYPNLPLYYEKSYIAAEHENFDSLHYLLTQFSKNFTKEEAEELDVEKLEAILNLCASAKNHSLELTKWILNKYPTLPITQKTLYAAIKSGTLETFQYLLDQFLHKWQDQSPKSEEVKDRLLIDVLFSAVILQQLDFISKLLKAYPGILQTKENKEYVLQTAIMATAGNKFDKKIGQTLSELAKVLDIPLNTDFITQLLKNANELISTDTMTTSFMLYRIIHKRNFALWLTSPERGHDRIPLNAESLTQLLQARDNSHLVDTKLDIGNFLPSIVNNPDVKALFFNWLKQKNKLVSILISSPNYFSIFMEDPDLKAIFIKNTKLSEPQDLTNFLNKTPFIIMKHLLNPKNDWPLFKEADAAFFLRAAYLLSQNGEAELANQILKPLTKEDLIHLAKNDLPAFLWSLETQPETLHTFQTHCVEIFPHIYNSFITWLSFAQSEHLSKALITRYNLADHLSPENSSQHRINPPGMT